MSHSQPSEFKLSQTWRKEAKKTTTGSCCSQFKYSGSPCFEFEQYHLRTSMAMYVVFSDTKSFNLWPWVALAICCRHNRKFPLSSFTDNEWVNTTGTKWVADVSASMDDEVEDGDKDKDNNQLSLWKRWWLWYYIKKE